MDINLTNKKFGKLTVKNFAYSKNSRKYWKCLCDCGKITYIPTKSLTSGNTKSCGHCKDIFWNNEWHSANEWSKILNINVSTIKQRLSKGLPLNKVFYKGKFPNHTKKVKAKNNNKKIGRPRILNTYTFKDKICIGKCINNTDVCFMVDINDYNIIKNFSWRVNNKGYIETFVFENKKRIRVFLHRLIMNVIDLDWKQNNIDHINGNKTDNRKCNLRICKNSENQINKLHPRKDNTSGYQGIIFDKRYNKWIAHIGVNKKNIYLGSFSNIKDAIQARINAEIKYYNEFSPNGYTWTD